MNAIIEKIDNEYLGEWRVVGQDNSFPHPLFYGTYEECAAWLEEKLENE